MIHPATELRFVSPEIGYGVFAREAIPRGTVVWVLCRLDMIFSTAEVAAFPPAYAPVFDRYAYIDAAGRHILCWDSARYINHSCDPAMLGVGDQVEIAVRDIAAGEELTCEYANLNLTEPMPCRCGAAGCRGTIGCDDVLTLWPDLDRRMQAALAQARGVPQPLLAFASEPEAFWARADGRAPLPSHRDFHAAGR